MTDTRDPLPVTGQIVTDKGGILAVVGPLTNTKCHMADTRRLNHEMGDPLAVTRGPLTGTRGLGVRGG